MRRAQGGSRDDGEGAPRTARVAIFTAVTVTMQAPFLFGSLGEELDVGGQTLNRILVSGFFVATAGGALVPGLQLGLSARTLIGLAPLLAAGSLAVLALTPGPVVAGAALAVGGLVNGAMTRATIGIVNGLPPTAVPGGLAELTVAAVSAPLFVGLVIGVASAAGIAPRAIMAGHAVFVACAAIVTLNGARQLPAGTGRRPRTGADAAPRVDRAPDGWRLITACAFTAAISSYVVAIFFVPFVRVSGVGMGAAGLALLFTSVVAATTRLWICRHPDVIALRSRHTSTLILAGAMGTGLLAVGSAALLSVAMPLIGIGAWGWIGLLMSASRHARNPVATGAAIQGSNFAAAAIGPLLAGVGVALIGSTLLLLGLTAMAAASAIGLWRPLARLDAAAAAA